MRIFNKFVESKKEPSNKNDIWFDGSVFRIYKEEEWCILTLSKEAIERLIQYAENVDIFKYVNTLPEVGDPNFIYFKKEDFYGNIIIVPYIYDGEWKQITNTELFGEASPFGFGNSENSAVLKGGDNQVISEQSVALGENNFVGLKGFYYKHIRFVSSTLANIYLSKTQVIPTITTGGEIKDTTINPADYLSKGDIISIVNDNKYNEIAVINNMSEGMIQIKWLSKTPFSSIKKETNLSPEDYSIYCLDKPTQGISDLGKYSFANGTDNKAINIYTEVSGKGNVAKGKFAKVWGKNNIGGYNTTTFGTNNINLADNSFVNGTNNINEGTNSVIHGNKNKNYGKRAFIVGNENINISENSVAMGSNNIAGLKGWYYKAIQFNTSTNVTFLYLSKTQQVPVIVASASKVEQEKDIDFTLIFDDIVSVVNDSKYDNKYKISTNEILTYGRIGIKSVDSDTPFPFNKVNTDDDLNEGIFDPEDYSIYCLSKPDAGIADMGQGSIVGGYNNKATNGKTTAFGYDNHAYGKFSFVEGRDNEAGYAAHAEGRGTKAEGEEAHAEGLNTVASGKHSHAEGDITEATGINAHAEGYLSKASGNSSHAEGGNWVKGATGADRINGGAAEGAGSHAEGGKTTAIADYSHAEGYRSTASGPNSHTEGQLTRTGGEDTDRPKGNPGTKSGQNAHAEGAVTFAQGAGSHAEGGNTWASGNYSHTEGWQTRTHEGANNSHAEGFYTETTNRAEHAEGEYNKSNDNTIHSVGIGTSSKRKNAHEITKDGKHYIIGIGGYDGTNPDSSEHLATVVAKGGGMTNVTYGELVELRNNSQLKAGMFYRITDYVTTTTQNDTQSAGHQFDIIVVADDVNTLNENARAIQHEGDNYFANSDLNAWQIWYCLDNDTDRFAWADAENGKGVIYRMIDEFNNDIPYDFKNILYVTNMGFKYNQWGSDYQFGRNSAIDKEIGGVQYYGWTSGSTPNAWSEPNCWTTVDVPATDMTLYKTDGSTISYGGSILSVNPEYSEKFTFNSGGDDSLNLDNIQTLNNTIEKFIRNDIQELNWNTFGGNCRNNKIGLGGHLNIFGDNCYDNILLGGDYVFGAGHYDGCFSNTFGNYCSGNTFGNSCSENTFGNNCVGNSFGNYCRKNSFGDGCSYNSLGNYCNENTSGDIFSDNSFGNDCSYNSFVNRFSENSFGNSCSYNSFGDSCSENTFGNSCDYNSFGNGCSENTFGNNCDSNFFGDACTFNSFGNDCNDNSFRIAPYSSSDLKPYCSYNHFDDGCSYIVIYNTGTTGSGYKLRNINVSRGVRGTGGSGNKHSFIQITDAQKNAEYEITVAKNTSGDIKIYCEADMVE